MGGYRNHPGGMGPISENTRGTMVPVCLEEVAATGSRAQRRWAQKKLTKINREKARQQATSASNDTPQQKSSVIPDSTPTLPSGERNPNPT